MMTKEPDSLKEQPQAVAFLMNFEMLKLELANVNQGISACILGPRVNGIWANPRYAIGDEVDEKTEADGSDSDGDYSAYNYLDEDASAQSLLRCPFCDFDIEFSSVRISLEEVHCYDPKNMLCPVCDEKLGEDAIRVAQNSSSQKRTWKSDKSSISSSDSFVLDKKLPARGSKHEPVPDPLLSPFIRNVSVPNSRGINCVEGSSSYASDISNAKGSGTDAPPDSEQDTEEKRLRASFVQDLVLSTFF